MLNAPSNTMTIASLLYRSSHKSPSLLLTVVGSFLLTSTNVALAMSCKDVFTRATQHSLSVDSRYPQIKLYQDRYHYKGHYMNDVMMGYEYLKSGPIFQNPNAFREYINENPTPRKSEMEEKFLGPSLGHISFEVGREKLWELQEVNPKAKVPAPKSAEIFAELKKYVPRPFFEELKSYIELVLNDARKRNYDFSVFTMTMRTEEYPDGFREGHNHGTGDLNYARAEIGPNTEIDLLNRQKPETILNEDYISVNSSETTAIFGGVWHRTPEVKIGQKRLLILVELLPN